MPKSRLGTCIDSGASRVYSPDRSNFANYKPIDRSITTADGNQLKAVGMGDLEVDLPNGSKTTKMMFKNAVHAPEMAFTLISMSRLDKAGYQVAFKKGMCTRWAIQGTSIEILKIWRICSSHIRKDVDQRSTLKAGPYILWSHHPCCLERLYPWNRARKRFKTRILRSLCQSEGCQTTIPKRE